MNWLAMERWSPYVVGIGIGILNCIAFMLSDRPIGCSAAYARTSGMIERLFRGTKVDEKPYYKRFVPVIEWEWMLVLGILVGAFISVKLSGGFKFSWVPSLWETTAGNTPVVRWILALLGGILIGFGARWAGGCTSGHGISGTSQLSASSWIAAICFFIGGVSTAMIIFRIFLT
jgi:uncharacterized membrane protein YedE/YeeE